MFNTWNLRHNADFETVIAPGLTWVPINIFGKCHYSKSELKEIMNSLPESAYKLNNLYEIVAGFQYMDFQEKTTNTLTVYNGMEFEVYESPEQAIEKKYGVCSGIASWLNYFLKKMFDSAGYIFFMRSTLSGHVINYFIYEGFYYIIDLNVLLPKYRQDIPIEDGNFSSFCSKKFFSGCLLKTKDLKCFIRFYEAYTAVANASFIFFKIEDHTLPPIGKTYTDNQITLYIKRNQPLEILNKKVNTDIFKVQYVK